MDAIGGGPGSFLGFKALYGALQLLGVLLIVLLVFWLTYYCGGFAWSDPVLQFNWHPLFMVFSLIYLAGNGMLIYRALRFERKRKLKLAHAAIQIVGFVAVVVGLQAVFSFHNAKGIANLYSLHSWLGISTVFLFACQWVAGLLSFLFPGIRSDLRAKYLPLHTSFGVIIFVMSCTSAILGLLEKAIFKLGDKKQYQNLVPEAVLINVMGILVFVFGAIAVYLVLHPAYKRVALTEDEMLLHRSIND